MNENYTLINVRTHSFILTAFDFDVWHIWRGGHWFPFLSEILFLKCLNSTQWRVYFYMSVLWEIA